VLASILEDKDPQFVPAVATIPDIPQAITALQLYADVINRMDKGQAREFELSKHIVLCFTKAGLKVGWVGDKAIGKTALKILRTEMERLGEKCGQVTKEYIGGLSDERQE
jgi:uncharacterized protein YigA (DUF484 family)